MPRRRPRSSLALVVVGVALVAGCGRAAASIPPVEQSPTTAPAARTGPPGPGTTGVPDGTVLTPSGALRITTDGTVIDGLDVTGSIVIAAADVTIRNTRVTADSPDVHRVIEGERGARNTLIEDVEVDGAGVADIGVDVSRAQLVRLDVHSSNDGVRMGSQIALRDSWVHGLVRKDDLHPDTVQGISAQDVQITGNVLDARGSDGQDLGNAAIMLGSETGTKLSRDVVIRDNLLDGGNYAINISGAINAQDFIIEGNTFGAGSRYGPIVTPASVTIGSGNVMAEDGTAAEVDRPR